MTSVPPTIWICGITASGKTTLGISLAEDLKESGFDNVEFLDSEELRKMMDRKYGFSVEERIEVGRNLVRIVSRLQQAGKITVLSTIAHKLEIRANARASLTNFMEVYLDCPVATCAKRDYKGHYKRAFAGEYDTFVGVTEDFELSVNPDLVLKTGECSLAECRSALLRAALKFIEQRSFTSVEAGPTVVEGS
jgi:adenylylsulfate kinase